MSQKYINLSSLFTDIADAIREKKRTNESIIADDFPDEISSIESGGGIINFEQKFIKRAIQLSIYENSRVTTIGDGAFYNYSSLTSVSFPQATTIGNSAFQRCSKLTLISFPQVINIGNSAFYYCSKLISAVFPYAISIGNYAFNYCSSLTSINFPQVTTIGNYAFASCPKLTSINFLQATTIGEWAFFSCPLLTSINFPKVTIIGENAFYRCSKLTSVSFPQVSSIGSGAFVQCTSLTSIILGGQQSQGGIIYSSTFSKCYKLTDLYLQGSYLYSLFYSNAFTSTPIGGYSASAGKFGSIYVPASLYSQYISATNWTYFSSRFVSISQSSGGNNSGGNNNDYGFTVSGNTLTITDKSKLNDGLLNTDDYLVVGIGLDEDGYEELNQAILNLEDYDYSIDFRIFNNELEQQEIYNEGLSIYLTDNNNNTYHCLLDENLFQYIEFVNVGMDSEYYGYIPAIHKSNIYNSLTFQIKNDLNFYILGYTTNIYDMSHYTLTEFFSIDNDSVNTATFDNWRENPIEVIELITDDMFEYPIYSPDPEIPGRT